MIPPVVIKVYANEDAKFSYVRVKPMFISRDMHDLWLRTPGVGVEGRSKLR